MPNNNTYFCCECGRPAVAGLLTLLEPGPPIENGRMIGTKLMEVPLGTPTANFYCKEHLANESEASRANEDS